jgi:hypothetical protein
VVGAIGGLKDLAPEPAVAVHHAIHRHHEFRAGDVDIAAEELLHLGLADGVRLLSLAFGTRGLAGQGGRMHGLCLMWLVAGDRIGAEEEDVLVDGVDRAGPADAGGRR